MNPQSFPLSPALIVAIVFVILVFVIIYAGAKTVPQGSEWTVERFGRYTRTLKPGLNIITPFFDRIGAKLSTMETLLNIPEQSVITKDNAAIRVDAIAFYQVLDTAKAAYQVRNLDGSMTNLVLTNIRTVMGSMSLDELLSERDKINSRLLDVVDHATDPWGVKVHRVEIKDIVPPDALIDAMARQMKADRDKRAVILEAEGAAQAVVLRAEAQKKSVTAEAEGRLAAAQLDAQARERTAAAEAKATEVVSLAIADGNIQAINYFIAQKYVEALGKLAAAPNQKVLMLPLDATGLMGSLAGIAEIARDALGPTGSGAPPPRPRATPPETTPRPAPPAMLPVPPPGPWGQPGTTT